MWLYLKKVFYKIIFIFYYKEEIKKIEQIYKNEFFVRNFYYLFISLIGRAKKIFYLIIKKILLIFLGKKIINKIARILYNIAIE